MKLITYDPDAPDREKWTVRRLNRHRVQVRLAFRHRRPATRGGAR